MSFPILFLAFLAFLWFAWQEHKNNQWQWAVVFVIAGLALFVMAYVSRY